VIIARGWSEEQRRAYVIADNKLAENASWDMDMLRAELSALGDAGLNFSALGFEEADLCDLLGAEEAPDADEVVEVAAERCIEARRRGCGSRCGSGVNAGRRFAALQSSVYRIGAGPSSGWRCSTPVRCR
jgi:hypothetical protein